jgi:hypothetical protein
MLGFRGASRYISDSFGEAFAMECEALKRVRHDMGLTNVEIMVPFVRTVKQAEAVARMLGERGLKLSGGERVCPELGAEAYYVTPALVEMPSQTAVVCDETFAPILYIMKYSTLDEAIALPTEKAARLALRTQQVLAYETDITATVDPFAGSYVIEAMTDELEAEILRLMGKVEDFGGAAKAIEVGFQKNEIETSAYDYALQIDKGERTVVGVNKFAIDVEEKYEPLRVDPAIGEQQVARLQAIRDSRNNADVNRALDSLKRAAESTDNVMYPMKEALAAKASGGEVADALREVWGRYNPPDIF